MKKTFLFSALVLFFAACEKTADIELPQTPPMMAVFGFVEEGKDVTIKLEEVVPIFGKTKRDPVPVSGASVVITEGTNSYTLTEGQGPNGTYSFFGFFQGEAGKTYTLEVKKAGFPDLKASCRVPDYLPNSVTHTYVAVPDPDGYTDSVRRIGYRWMDRQGTTDYYRFTAVANFNGLQEAYVQFLDQNMPDESKDGEEIYTGLGTFWQYSTGNPTASLEVSFELMVLDVHAFKYMRTFDAAYYNEGNPFAEPVIMYTNVEGGIGVFGGVTRKFFNTKIY
jgi:hypothetical protein